MLFVAYTAYIWYEAPEEEQNIGMLLYMLTESEVSEEDESFENPIDMLFNELEEKDPENFALMQYKAYKKAAGKTAKSSMSISRPLRAATWWTSVTSKTCRMHAG